MQTLPKKILVIRLSAMGDVAMTVPVLSSLVNQHEVEVLMLTDKLYSPFFAHLPRVKVIPFDKKNQHKGISGLFRLYFALKKENIDAVADMHDVLRSQFLRGLLIIGGIQLTVIDKDRTAKKRLTRLGKDKNSPLKHTVLRYQKVLEDLGFQFEIQFKSIFSKKPDLLATLKESVGDKSEAWIGIAPFAKHAGKIYPLQKMEEVLALLEAQGGIKIFLFGNGLEEMQVMSDWQQKFKQVQWMPTKVGLPEELNLMANLDVMLSMDSANMHLASLVGLPVVSVWGATHHYAGFLGWNQSLEHLVEVDLPCRPCSVYGNKSCKREDYACLNEITPQQIVDKINFILKLNK